MLQPTVRLTVSHDSLIEPKMPNRIQVPVSLPFPQEYDVCCMHQEYNLVKPAGLDLVPLFPTMEKKCFSNKILYAKKFTV